MITFEGESSSSKIDFTIIFYSFIQTIKNVCKNNVYVKCNAVMGRHLLAGTETNTVTWENDAHKGEMRSAENELLMALSWNRKSVIQ